MKVAVTGSTERGLTAYLAALHECAPELDVVMLLPGGETDAVSVMREADGLLVTGGVDVHPGEYGEEPAGTEMANVQPGRDALERLALEIADERGLPVLAICRGMQMLNVHRGGALLQDIPGHRDGRPQEEKWRGFHFVALDPASRLVEALRETDVDVNSRHHQAVDTARVGQGLHVVGTASDGVVEALEGAGERFVVGVQWHPENMVLGPDGTGERDEARALFEAFAAAVGAGAPLVYFGREDRTGISRRGGAATSRGTGTHDDHGGERPGHAQSSLWRVGRGRRSQRDHRARPR